MERNDEVDLTFIGITRHLREDSGPSTLAISDDDPLRLRVVGILPHSTLIEPRTIADAERLREYLKLWIVTQVVREHAESAS
jgi:hypothetical protein